MGRKGAARVTAEEKLQVVLYGWKRVDQWRPVPAVGVSEVTYYKLRDRLLTTGMEGLSNSGHPRCMKAMEDRIRDLELALRHKSPEVELLEKRRPRSSNRSSGRDSRTGLLLGGSRLAQESGSGAAGHPADTSTRVNGMKNDSCAKGHIQYDREDGRCT